jgi:hypothetical protein
MRLEMRPSPIDRQTPTPTVSVRIGVRAGQEPCDLAEVEGFEPSRAVNPTRFPSERHRPLGDTSAQEVTRRRESPRNRLLRRRRGLRAGGASDDQKSAGPVGVTVAGARGAGLWSSDAPGRVGGGAVREPDRPALVAAGGPPRLSANPPRGGISPNPPGPEGSKGQ